jgi:hypothetical protein
MRPRHITEPEANEPEAEAREAAYKRMARRYERQYKRDRKRVMLAEAKLKDLERADQ